MTHLQSIAHRRLQSERMNTKPDAGRWSFHLSVSTLLQMVNFVTLCLYYTFPISFPFFHGSLFCGPHDYNWFQTHNFTVQPFDHNAIACFPDLMPSLWSILLWSKYICVIVCLLPLSAIVLNFATHVAVCTVYLWQFCLGKYCSHDFGEKNESFILVYAIK